MPDVAGDSDDGVLAAWLVGESARFDAAQTIAYVETADELFSVEAGRPGLLLKTLVEPGTRVQPGSPIGILGEPWEQVEDLEAVLAELGIVRREPVGASSVLEAPVAAHRADPTPPGPIEAPETLSVVADASPAEEAGFETLAERAAQEAEPVAEKPEDDPASQHHYLRARVRVDRLVTLSTRLERDRPESSVLDLLARAVIAAHRQVPQMGVARIEQDKGASPGIPVTYPGRFGVEEAAAVVPSGQAAALAVGAVRDEPVIDAGAVVPGKVMTLTLSVRAGRVDDVQASRWLAVLVALLERPEWLID
jgi:pyruvate/2-oxoglutarate dehydrogenase complex dihydrolipoamide acyltransferase (E2) component